MKYIFSVLLGLSALVSVSATTGKQSEHKHSWPRVSPMERSFHLVDHQQPAAEMLIRSSRGATLYFLQCYLNAGERDDPNFDYSGDFECRLTSLYSEDTYSTLLTEDKHQSSDWESRGRFLVQELVGQCAQYPEYGAVRHFRLRGMELTLAVSGLKMEKGSRARNAPWNVDRVGALDLKVIVAPDPGATSAIAERTRYLRPPRAHPQDPKNFALDCSQVRRR